MDSPGCRLVIAGNRINAVRTHNSGPASRLCVSARCAGYDIRKWLPTGAGFWLVLTGATLGLVIVHYYFVPWTHLIEVTATTGWCALNMMILQSRLALFRDWPNIVLPVYLGSWPITQTVLAIYPDITVPTLVTASLLVVIALALILRGIADLTCRPVHRRVQPA